MEELLNILIQYAKMQKGYEEMAENAKRLEQWEFYDDHLASSVEMTKKINQLKIDILNLVPNEN